MIKQINKSIKEAKKDRRDKSFYTESKACFICRKLDTESNLPITLVDHRAHKECWEFFKSGKYWCCDKCSLWFDKDEDQFTYQPKWDDNVVHNPSDWTLCKKCFDNLVTRKK